MAPYPTDLWERYALEQQRMELERPGTSGGIVTIDRSNHHISVDPPEKTLRQELQDEIDEWLEV